MGLFGISTIYFILPHIYNNIKDAYQQFFEHYLICLVVMSLYSVTRIFSLIHNGLYIVEPLCSLIRWRQAKEYFLQSRRRCVVARRSTDLADQQLTIGEWMTMDEWMYIKWGGVGHPNGCTISHLCFSGPQAWL